MWDVENSMVLDSEWGGREYCDGGNFSGFGHWDDEPDDGYDDDYDNARDMWYEQHEED